MSTDSALREVLTGLLPPHGYRLLSAPTREEAHALLVQDEEIVFIVGDIDEHLTLVQAQSWLLENRSQIAWARLPAAALVPQALTQEKAALRESGVMATMFDKPVNGAELVAHIRRSRAQ
jgi:DNA-binding response OmpR family regulator